MSMDTAYLKRLVFIDAKKIYIKPEGTIKSWALKGVTNRSTVITSPLLNNKHRGWCLNYYIAVNAAIGPVRLKLVTGGRGAGILPSKYKVGGIKKDNK
jgi:hypothetical protein